MYKQVIAVRTDLKLGKGKLASQVAHASLEAYRRAASDVKGEWERSGAKKIVVKVSSLKELLELHKKAMDRGLPAALITDAGRTQIRSGTKTSLGIGPCEEKEADKIAGKLKLL
jgi:PTH2 family peptidyl-tRNA hydrolase